MIKSLFDSLRKNAIRLGLVFTSIIGITAAISVAPAGQIVFNNAGSATSGEYIHQFPATRALASTPSTISGLVDMLGAVSSASGVRSYESTLVDIVGGGPVEVQTIYDTDGTDWGYFPFMTYDVKLKDTYGSIQNTDYTGIMFFQPLLDEWEDPVILYFQKIYFPSTQSYQTWLVLYNPSDSSTTALTYTAIMSADAPYGNLP